MTTYIMSPTGHPIAVHKDGRIEGDYEDLAGWVRSGSHRDPDDFMRWFLFLKEWGRQRIIVPWEDEGETLGR